MIWTESLQCNFDTFNGRDKGLIDYAGNSAASATDDKAVLAACSRNVHRALLKLRRATAQTGLLRGLFRSARGGVYLYRHRLTSNAGDAEALSHGLGIALGSFQN